MQACCLVACAGWHARCGKPPGRMRAPLQGSTTASEAPASLPFRQAAARRRPARSAVRAWACRLVSGTQPAPQGAQPPPNPILSSGQGRTGSASAGASSPAPGTRACPGSAPGTRPGRSAPAASLARGISMPSTSLLRLQMCCGHAHARRCAAAAAHATKCASVPQPRIKTRAATCRRHAAGTVAGARAERARAPWSSQSRTA